MRTLVWAFMEVHSPLVCIPGLGGPGNSVKPQLLSRSAQDRASLFPGKCLPLSHNCDLKGEPTDSLPHLGPPAHLPGYPVSVHTVNLKEKERDHPTHQFQALRSPRPSGTACPSSLLLEGLSLSPPTEA